ITNFVHTWWLWSWLIFFVFTMFMMYISPYILEPLFNKFNPVEDEELIVKLKNLMSSVGIKINKVLKIDASKRTMHTNAYFSGIGNVKRIVLFDTLMEKMDNDEIVSVIAHEAGHWKKKHVIKNIIVLEIITFIFFFAAYCLIKTDLLMSIFDIGTLSSVPDVYYCSVKLFLIYFLFGIVLFPLTPVMHYFSRKHEYEADRFAVDLLNDSSSLKSALIKLSTDNLSNLYPHPIYEAFNYSHPSILKRLGYLADLGKDTNEVKHKNN
ncbi:MAG: M48 family metallopeptidase, partial [Victivallales bacterium]|nr:M48 family metallopeptidase [Victivallales bacterium]